MKNVPVVLIAVCSITKHCHADRKSHDLNDCLIANRRRNTWVSKVIMQVTLLNTTISSAKWALLV